MKKTTYKGYEIEHGKSLLSRNANTYQVWHNNTCNQFKRLKKAKAYIDWVVTSKFHGQTDSRTFSAYMKMQAMVD